MKNIIFIIIIFFLKSDSIINKSDVEFTIKNKEIYFIDTAAEAETYLNKEEKDKSFTLVELQIRNNSNRKLILFIDPNNFYFQKENPFSDKKYCEYSHLILDNNKIVKVTQVLSKFIDYPIGLDNIKNYKDINRKKKYESLGLSEIEFRAFELYENYSFCLGINESKTIYFSLNLPIESEINPDILQNSVRYNIIEEDWGFKFVYFANGKNIYEDLPSFVKDELKQNHVEIFDGTVYSNLVKLKKRE
jgi:hypothetical protein